MLFAFILFILFFTVGLFSAKEDPAFIREMLSDDYVDMTEKNIEEGNPFGVYGYGNSFLTWIWIMFNNIAVSLRYFVEGIFFCFLTIFHLVQESIRVGAFEYMFAAKGLGFQWVTTVLIHGTLELSAIILASGAGIVLGKSFLFPGTISRWKALQIGVKDGVKIVVGLMPVLMVAAFFEGFVTRHYKMPVIFSLLILFASASFIVWYFIIYPIRLQKAKQKDLTVAHV
jgi:uncharacterized membrane protein SpoIIM required for sporulation